MFYANGQQAGDVVSVGGTDLRFSHANTHIATAWWSGWVCQCSMSHMEIYYGRLEATHAAQSMARQMPGPGCTPE